MLRVSLLGNLGADPEVRFNAKGAAIVSFRVAVNQVRTGPDGERQENTEWFRVRVMGRQAEFAQRLGKGSKVLVFGRLDISHYTSRDGEARTGFDVWADDVQSMTTGPRPMAEPEGFMDGGEAEGEPALAGASAAPAASSGTRTNGKGSRGGASNDATPPPTDLEDLPF
jgi:single-strand DNA-binding protein